MLHCRVHLLAGLATLQGLLPYRIYYLPGHATTLRSPIHRASYLVGSSILLVSLPCRAHHHKTLSSLVFLRRNRYALWKICICPLIIFFWCLADYLDSFNKILSFILFGFLFFFLSVISLIIQLIICCMNNLSETWLFENDNSR